MPRQPRTSSNGHVAEQSIYSGLEPMVLNQLREVANSAIVSLRTDLIRAYRGFDRRRNLNDECGYPDTGQVTSERLWDLHEREPLANRVNVVKARESWQVTPMVYETEDAEVVTPFEEAWDDLGRQLSGEASWYHEEESSPIWAALQLADEMCGVGQYGIILLGLDDGEDISKPVRGMLERNSDPAGADGKAGGAGANGQAGSPSAPPRPALNRWSLTFNREETKGRKLLYLRVFPEHLAQITQWESNPTSPRYMQPVMYSVTFNDLTRQFGGIGMPTATKNVHWSRVIHVADNSGSNPVLGMPRVLPVVNSILDAQKIRGGSAEGAWQASVPGMSLETHPQLGGDVSVNKTATRQMLEEFRNGLQRELILSGMSAKNLAPNSLDPTGHIGVQIESICIQLNIPVRIFKGSERGQLASSQDERDWKRKMAARRKYFNAPRIVIPFVDRLIAVGVLPEPTYVELVEQPKPSPFDQLQRQEVPEPPAGDEAAQGEESGQFAGLRRLMGNRGPEGAALEGDDAELDEVDETPDFLKPEEEEEEPVKPPKKPGWMLEWPEDEDQTKLEQAQVAGATTGALAQYVSGGVESIMPPLDYLTRVLGYDEEEAAAILESAAEAMEERDLEQQLQAQDQMDQQEEAVKRGIVPDPNDPDLVPDQVGGPPAPFGGGKPGFGGGPPKGRTPPQLAPFARRTQGLARNEDGEEAAVYDSMRALLRGKA